MVSGEDFTIAQKELRHRQWAYDDPLATELLSTLMVLAQICAEPTVIAIYARGCRYACFDQPISNPSDTPGDIKVQPRPELAKQLTALAHKLLTIAEDQEYVDARLNAIAYRKAAGEISRAAMLLA